MSYRISNNNCACVHKSTVVQYLGHIMQSCCKYRAIEYGEGMENREE
jgi:hypothetical protein